jgi:hypothetical protein
MKPRSKVIQIIKLHNDGNNFDTITCLALCEDGSIWFYYPGCAELKNKFELVSEMENEKYIC